MNRNRIWISNLKFLLTSHNRKYRFNFWLLKICDFIILYAPQKIPISPKNYESDIYNFRFLLALTNNEVQVNFIQAFINHSKTSTTLNSIQSTSDSAKKYDNNGSKTNLFTERR